MNSYLKEVNKSFKISLRRSTYLGGAKLRKYFLEKFVIIKNEEIVNLNNSLLILMITNMIKFDKSFEDSTYFFIYF